MRHKKASIRKTQPDMLYNNQLVTKFINNVMKDGKKTIAQRNVYEAFELLKAKNEDPLQVFEKALNNVGPKVEVKARRVGGANYQVPIEVRSDRKVSLAIRWILEAATKRSNKEFRSFAEKLAAEFLDASNNAGDAVRKRENALKQAEANRAFSHFRW